MWAWSGRGSNEVRVQYGTDLQYETAQAPLAQDRPSFGLGSSSVTSEIAVAALTARRTADLVWLEAVPAAGGRAPAKVGREAVEPVAAAEEANQVEWAAPAALEAVAGLLAEREGQRGIWTLTGVLAACGLAGWLPSEEPARRPRCACPWKPRGEM